MEDRRLNLLVAYPVDEVEELPEAVVNAFRETDVDVTERATPLEAWVDTDVFDVLRWDDRPVSLSTRIWDHRVVVTGDEVRIYAAADVD